MPEHDPSSVMHYEEESGIPKFADASQSTIRRSPRMMVLSEKPFTKPGMEKCGIDPYFGYYQGINGNLVIAS